MIVEAQTLELHRCGWLSAVSAAKALLGYMCARVRRFWGRSGCAPLLVAIVACVLAWSYVLCLESWRRPPIFGHRWARQIPGGLFAIIHGALM